VLESHQPSPFDNVPHSDSGLPAIPRSHVADSAVSISELKIATQYLYSLPDELRALPPQHLLEAMLGRVLVGGIGRLFIQRSDRGGRILWSQNGVLQSVLGELPPMIVQGVLDELKQMFQLPPTPILKSKLVEMTCLYQQSRLLLRLQILPSAQGEEATLQVLRGAALKFRQRQKISGLSQDAFRMALDLQRTIAEIRTRVDMDAIGQSEMMAVLPSLIQLVEAIHVQLDDLNLDLADASENQEQPKV
jgi:hypothetical protein